MNLNGPTQKLADSFVDDQKLLRVAVDRRAGARVIDCGISAPGGLEAGRRLAEVCLAGLGQVAIVAGDPAVWAGPAVAVRTDHPIAACLASQYAGWQIASEDYFAMASGPMRAAAAREELFGEAALAPFAQAARGGPCVGVLEASKPPPEAVCREIATQCGVEPERLTLLVAPTNSQAGSLQVAARSVETALHKLHELGFDLTRVESGWGVAPLPPVAGDALGGIGRTNDAVLYGGQVVLCVRGDDDSLAEIGPRVPSCSSRDHGRPFAEVFADYGHDFYQVDPLLFSPAVVGLVNLDTGRTHQFGRFEPAVLSKSFGRA